VVPNSDVSGVGVRWALLIQAVSTIILSMLPLESSEILFTSLTTQATSLSIIVATYFDPTVDVVHSVVASQFAVLLSMYRITPVNFPTSLPRTRASMKLPARLGLLDFFLHVIVFFEL